MSYKSYKGHKIYQTHTVLLENTLANAVRRLYRIEGRFSKEAGTRPFLTSKRGAMRYINDAITAEETAAAYEQAENPF